MEVNLKSFRKLVIAVFLIVGCDNKNEPLYTHKNQAVVILDKTNSVCYTNSLPKLRQELIRNFEQTYVSTTKDIQYSRLVITGDTRVFPVPCRFENDYPVGDDDDRMIQTERQRWKMDKRKWIFDELKQVDSLIQSPCKSNTTDIFSIFDGIQQVQNTKGPWDSLNVFIFSDMVNTNRTINMKTGITMENANAKGKRICQDLIEHGQITTEKNGNLYLTIYTPDNMDKTALVKQFWKGFFEQWGLRETHYHFE